MSRTLRQGNSGAPTDDSHILGVALQERRARHRDLGQRGSNVFAVRLHPPLAQLENVLLRKPAANRLSGCATWGADRRQLTWNTTPVTSPCSLASKSRSEWFLMTAMPRSSSAAKNCTQVGQRQGADDARQRVRHATPWPPHWGQTSACPRQTEGAPGPVCLVEHRIE